MSAHFLRPRSSYLAGLAIVPAALFAAEPASYEITGGVTGGGASKGGSYEIVGTAGQADAGAMSGGRYAVVGGFWASAIQTPGAPNLTITGTQVNGVTWLELAWPADSFADFRLQYSPTLSPSAWADVTAQVEVTGATRRVLLQAEGSQGFFRLAR